MLQVGGRLHCKWFVPVLITDLPMENARRCPICKKPVDWNENVYRPFCSDRCSRLDLGNWASERYAIPGDIDPMPDEGPEPANESCAGGETGGAGRKRRR